MTYQFNLVKVKRLFDGEKNYVGTCYLVWQRSDRFLNFSSPKLFWKRNYLAELFSANRRMFPTNCCSVYNHFVGLMLKGLKDSNIINPFHSNFSHINPLKTSESQKFFDIFRGYRKWILMKWANASVPRLSWSVSYGRRTRFETFQSLLAILETGQSELLQFFLRFHKLVWKYLGLHLLSNIGFGGWVI